MHSQIPWLIVTFHDCRNTVIIRDETFFKIFKSIWQPDCVYQEVNRPLCQNVNIGLAPPHLQVTGSWSTCNFFFKLNQTLSFEDSRALVDNSVLSHLKRLPWALQLIKDFIFYLDSSYFNCPKVPYIVHGDLWKLVSLDSFSSYSIFGIIM